MIYIIKYNVHVYSEQKINSSIQNTCRLYKIHVGALDDSYVVLSWTNPNNIIPTYKRT